MSGAPRIPRLLRRPPYVTVGVPEYLGDRILMLGTSKHTETANSRCAHPRTRIAFENDKLGRHIENPPDGDTHTHLAHPPRLIRETRSDRGRGRRIPHVQQSARPPQFWPVQRRRTVENPPGVLAADVSQKLVADVSSRE